METKQVILRGYLSHPIRGRKGNECPPEEVEQNCIKAAQDGANIMAYVQRCGIPLFLYVPGAHDDFVQKAYKAGRITETEILDTDCDIVTDCDFLLVYDWQDYISGGMKYEHDYCCDHDIPVYTIKKIDQHTLWELQYDLLEMLLDKLDEPHIIKIGDTNERSV